METISFYCQATICIKPRGRVKTEIGGGEKRNNWPRGNSNNNNNNKHMHTTMTVMKTYIMRDTTYSSIIALKRVSWKKKYSKVKVLLLEKKFKNLYDPEQIPLLFYQYPIHIF